MAHIHFKPTRMINLKKHLKKCRRGCGETRTFIQFWWICKWGNHIRNSLKVSKNNKYRITKWLSKSTPREICKKIENRYEKVLVTNCNVYMCWGWLASHTTKQFFWVSYDSAQFWHYLPGNSCQSPPIKVSVPQDWPLPTKTHFKYRCYLFFLSTG